MLFQLSPTMVTVSELLRTLPVHRIALVMSYEDNRKRVHSQDDIGAAITSKRAALGLANEVHQESLFGSSESALYFKLLCPQTMTGIIIGKGGATINQLNVSTGAKIKLSQNNEFFPTTNDRVLVLCGDRLSLQNAITELVTRIAEAAEKKSSNPADNKSRAPSNRSPDGSYLIRVLIPRPSAGLLIGRGGSVVKQMEESSRCKFQLGEEADPHGTNERIMIVNASSAGDLVQGVQNIMHQLLNNPRVRVYTNVTTVYDSSIPAGMQNSSSGMAPLANPPVPMGMGMGPPSGPTAGLPSVVPPNGMMYAPASMLQVGGYQVQSVPYPAAAASMMMTSIPAQQVHPVNMNVPGAHTNNTGKMMAQPQVGVVSASNGPGSGVPAGYPQYAMHQQGMYGQHAQMYGGTGAQNPYMQQGQQQGQTPQQQAVSQPTPTQTTATAGMYTYQQPPPQQQQQGAPATATGYPNAQQILQGYHSMQPALAETAQAGMAQGQQVMQQQPISGVQAAPQGVFQQGMMMMMPPQGQGQGMMQPGMPMQLQQHQHPQQGMPYGVPPQGMPHQQGMMMMTPQQQQYAMMTSAGPYAAAAQPAYGGASSFQSQQQAQPAQQQQQYGAQYNQQYQYYDPNLAQAGSYGGYTGAGTGKKR